MSVRSNTIKGQRYSALRSKTQAWASFEPRPVRVVASPITSAILQVDMGGFQAGTFGQMTVAFNGIVKQGLLNFEDGAFATAVRNFVVSPADIAAANVASQFVFSITRGSTIDGVAFDYFSLSGDTAVAAVPVPGLGALLGIAAGAFAFSRRRKTT